MATAKGSKGKGAADVAKSEADVDALFQLPLAEFTAARNALASRLKKGKHTEEADHVRSLPKPSVPAWTVNQLFWRRREAFDRLIAAGERFRAAQAAQLGGQSADLRGPLDARREVLSELSRMAAATLRDAGSTPTPDAMRRITTTLEALSTYGAAPEAPRAGRLTDDVDPPGFETLAALVPRVGKSTHSGPSRLITFPPKPPAARTAKRKATTEEEAARADSDRKARLAAAKAAVHAAERAVRDARTAAQKAEELLKKAAARAKDADKEKADAEQRLEKAAAAADAAKQQARKVAVDAEDAAQAVEDAERDLETVRRGLQDLG